MFATFGRSFKLIGESYRVLRKDPELIWLAVASFAAVAVIAVVFGGFGFGTGMIDPNSGTISGPGIIVLAIGYLISYFAIIYFQVALVSAVLYRMGGGDPDLRYALGEANKRLGAIFIWAAIAATVGLILRALESMASNSNNGSGNIVGSIIVSLLGFAWGLMVFFVVPVIVVEDVSGVTAIKRSATTLKRRWGEAIIGNQGVGLVVTLAVVVAGGAAFALGNAAMGVSAPLGWLFMGAGAVVVLFLVAGGSALDSTYRAVLYRYATEGETGGFSKEVLDSAFRPKRDIRSSF